MEPRKAFLASPFSLIMIFFLTISLCGVKASSEAEEDHAKSHEGPVVKKDQRRILHAGEYGEISAVDIKDGHKGPPYHLQFITLEPNSLFLPVLLHANMVFYVHTGRGRLTWVNDDGTSTINLREGDLCSLREGYVFYIRSNLEAERRKLRIYAMFAHTEDNTYDPSIGAYSRINELVKGFDKKIMQAALKVPEDVVEAITNKTETPVIVHAVSERRNAGWEVEALFLRNLLGVPSNSKKLKKYNIFDHDPDFENCNGWSIAVTKKQLKSLKHSNIGFMMVNLTMGSMLGPHWNPWAIEIAAGLAEKGMVRVVCGENNDEGTECKNMRFKVEEGDVFVVPRFHPMAQMSFNDGRFVFLGFTTAAKKNNPQFLTGKGSLLQILDKRILASSLGVSNRTVDRLLSSRDDFVIFECTSCAEEEEKIMKEEKEKEEEREREEERKREEEETRKREEEKRKREEEEARKREEEEARKREEEKARREEEDRKREEEEIRKREAEEEEAKRQKEKRKREEEEVRKREEEKARKREEEKARREEEARKREEEEARKREEEEAKRQKERREREEKARRKEEERKREEEEAKKQQERKKEQEEEARKTEEERKREEEKGKKEQERKREQEEEARKTEEERKREEEKGKRQQEERERKREEEEEKARRQREEKKREKKREEEAKRKREEEIKREEEEAERQQEKREKRREEEAKREKEGEAKRQKEEEAKKQKERKKEEQEEAQRKKEETERKEEVARREEEKRKMKKQEKEARKEYKRRQEEGKKEQEGSKKEAQPTEEEVEAKRQQEEREKRRKEEEEGGHSEGETREEAK